MVAVEMKKSLALSAVAILATIVLVSAQTTPLAAEQQAQLQGAMARFRSMFQLDSMVQTGVSELGGQKVYVHVPGGLFDLKLDTRADNQGVRISQTVLGRLVSIFMDRTRDPSLGTLAGPISIKVAGLKVYENEEARAMGPLASIAPPAA